MNNYELDFECSFNNDVEGHTFVIMVNLALTVGGHEKTASFEVNCQFSDGKNYDGDTYQVMCHNDSGGDYRDSGLAAWIEGHGLECESDSLIAEINACAKLHVLSKYKQTISDDCFAFDAVCGKD